MASYRAVGGALGALKDLLARRMAEGFDPAVENPDVRLLGSLDLKNDPTGNALGIYLHRVSVDPYGRNRYLRPNPPNQAPQPELPVNLHLLLIAWTGTAAHEGTLLGWGMQQLGSALQLDISHLGTADSSWDEAETLQVIPEDMSTEDLLRIWDGLPRDYLLSTPYVMKTLRLAPLPEVSAGPPVTTIVTPMAER